VDAMLSGNKELQKKRKVLFPKEKKYIENLKAKLQKMMDKVPNRQETEAVPNQHETEAVPNQQETEAVPSQEFEAVPNQQEFEAFV
jgi:hypothetical protein